MMADMAKSTGSYMGLLFRHEENTQTDVYHGRRLCGPVCGLCPFSLHDMCGGGGRSGVRVHKTSFALDSNHE